MSSEFLLTTGKKNYRKEVEQPLIDVNNPHVLFGMGARNSGKGVLKENIVEILWRAYITVFEAWSGRDGESAYYSLNKNCKEQWTFTRAFFKYFWNLIPEEHRDEIKNFILNPPKNVQEKRAKNAEIEKYLSTILIESWDKMKHVMDIPNDEMFQGYIDKFLGKRMVGLDKNNSIHVTLDGITNYVDEPLHCNCFGSYPIVLMVPDYVFFDEELVKNSPANKQCFRSYHEFEHYWASTTEGKAGIPSPFPRDANFWKIPLPEHMQKHNLEIMKFPVPYPAKRTEFIEWFIKTLAYCRDNHRILVNNPMFYLGEDDKFVTMQTIINFMERIPQTDEFEPMSEEKAGMPRYMWKSKNPKYLSWSKVAIILDELKTLAPTNKLSGQGGSSKTKKSLYDKVSEIRHWNIYGYGFFQRPNDILDSIRDLADKYVFKRASKNLLGKEYEWIFDSILQDRENEYMRKYHISEEIVKRKPYEIAPLIRTKVEKRFPLPNELPDDVGIVTIENRYEYIQIPQNRHHHKHSKDHFKADFKLKWWFQNKETGEKMEGAEQEKESEPKLSRNEKRIVKRTHKREAMTTYQSLMDAGWKRPAIARHLHGEAEYDKLSKDDQEKINVKWRVAFNRWIDEQKPSEQK